MQLLQKLKAAVKKVTPCFTKETITNECKHIAAKGLHSTQYNTTIPFDPWIVHPQ
jgi:hypothetical protein